jgi:succinate-semialdehyde dehydrogenase/glutarate-semialdehyde dehydrogenase
MILQSINPYTGALIREYEEPSDDMLKERLSGSAAAFRKWRTTEFLLRRSLLKQTANILMENTGEYSLCITNEMGKPISESKAEVEKCAWVCHYYADNGESFLKEDLIPTDALTSYVRYEPLGPILGIMPWNFPFWQVFRFAVPTLMAGNTVVLKHASNVQGCAAKIEEIFLKAGFPGDVFINLPVGSARVAGLIENDVIRGVSLTGSEAAGQKVAEITGKNLKKSLLELGGSNAFIVLEDANIEMAAATGVKARMLNGGQSCIAAKRFILHKKISERFIKLFLENMAALKTGDPADFDTRIGPLASVSQAKSVEKQVNDSVDMGAVIMAGGDRHDAFYPPTLLTGVRPGMPVFDEEVFGPVAPIIIAEDTEEAVDLANNTRYGLGVTLFTGNLEKGRMMVDKFRDGAVFINELVKSDPRLPFGGTGRSGYGRELSIQGIREFVNAKTVYVRLA